MGTGKIEKKHYFYNIIVYIIVIIAVHNMQALQAQQKKALLVWGGWNGHEPKKCVEIFAPWLESAGFNVTISDSLGIYTDKEFMRSLDIIIQIWTMGKISGAQERGLLEAQSGQL